MTTVDRHLRLLDRQVLDRDDLLVSKVDDIELHEGPDGRRGSTRR